MINENNQQYFNPHTLYWLVYLFPSEFFNSSLVLTISWRSCASLRNASSLINPRLKVSMLSIIDKGIALRKRMPFMWLGFPLRGPCRLGNPLPQAEKGPKYEGWVNSGAISESESGDSSCLVVSWFWSWNWN